VKIESILDKARALGISLWAEGDALHYSGPPDALSDDLVRDLSINKKGILGWLRETAKAEPDEALQIAPVPRDAQGVLSFAQERLWFLDQIEPGDPAYNIMMALRFEGVLDIDALSASLEAIVARHAVLRTSFGSENGRPLQRIAAQVSLDVAHADLSALEPTRRAAELAHMLRSEARRGFDLSCAPLIRAALARLAPSHHVLMLTVHHIVSDGWSLGVLYRELAALYRERAAEVPARLPELPVAYADFAASQRQWARTARIERQLEYLRASLRHLPVLNLPTDHTRPPVQTSNGAAQFCTLPASLRTQLEAVGRSQGATLFMTLLAAFAILMQRYCAQDDVVLGSPAANRRHSATEGVLGMFVNMLVMRLDASGEQSFTAMLLRVRETVLKAYAHQDVPFEMLVEEFGGERDLSRNPLFQVVFAEQAPFPSAVDLGAVTLRPEPIEAGSARFDLEAHVSTSESGIHVAFIYNTDLFEAQTVGRMLSHYQRVLEEVVRVPERPLNELSFLEANERRQAVVEWNQTTTLYPRDCAIHELFEQQAAASPEATAIAYHEHVLSYAALNARANRLARRLRAAGVDRETLVGLCVERSLDCIVAMLAILKAGGAYVPLDPEYPPARLAFMLEDTGASVLVTQARLRQRLPEYAGQVIEIDADQDAGGEALAANLGLPCDGARLAYVMYTSGSTGVPKGVCIEHRSVIRLVRSTNYLELGPQEVLLQFAPISFDASTLEIWGALLNGAKLAVHPPGVVSLDELAREIRHHGITVLWLTGALFRQMVDLHLEDLRGVRQLLAGGEALSVPHVLRVLASLAPGARFINGYGPTENTTFTCCHVMDAESRVGATVPIGRPISNTRVYVLDARMRPVPVGVPGELYIAGDGLARAYWNRPELTAERFVQNVLEEEPGARLYRSGDLVRARPDGSIEYLGRLDQQIKIRGFRVEPGEIESVLARHASVRDAVVVCREDRPGDKRLVAYATPRPGAVPSAAALRAFVANELPGYMVPAAVVVMDSLPVTSNGKVDRSALPAPRRDKRTAADSRPHDDVERALVDVWREVLRIEEVGTEDNFFELGGDSILTIQMVAAARRCGLLMHPRDVFQCPTISELSRLARRNAPPSDAGKDPTGRLAPTPIQHWFFEQDLVDPHHFNQSVLLEAPRGVDRACLAEALSALIDHHDVLRLRAEEGTPKRLQISTVERDVPFSVIDLTAVAPADLEGALDDRCREIEGSLDLLHGPVLRLALFDRGPANSARMLLAVHHLAVDAVSWRILVEDLNTAYAQRLAGSPVALPQRTTPYRLWSAKLAEYAGSARAVADGQFWLQRRDEACTPLPFDTPDALAENTHASVRRVSGLLDATDTERLLRDVHHRYGTRISDLLLSALALALRPWIHARTFAVDLEGHGRADLFADVDLSRTVGWFTAIYPFVLDLDAGRDVPSLIRSTKDALRQIPHGGVPYGALRYMSPDASIGARLRAVGDCPVSFNYLGQFDQLRAGAQLLRVCDAASPYPYSPRNRRAHLIEIKAAISGGRLHVGWDYASRVYRESTMRALADSYVDALRALIAHCTSSSERSYTPTDFPEAGLDQKGLDTLLTRLGRKQQEKQS
jgi:amino acid adenylation domain-containing protein/non-ribosomal peptide synthase protein (TIGR01720 family)